MGYEAGATGAVPHVFVAVSSPHRVDVDKVVVRSHGKVMAIRGVLHLMEDLFTLLKVSHLTQVSAGIKFILSSCSMLTILSTNKRKILQVQCTCASKLNFIMLAMISQFYLMAYTCTTIHAVPHLEHTIYTLTHTHTHTQLTPHYRQ